MECNVSRRTFSQNKDYLRHVRGHDQAKNFTCGKCNKAFKRKDSQLRHERNCNQQEQPSGSGIRRQPRAPTSIPSQFKIIKTRTTFGNANITWKLKYVQNNGDGYMDLIDASTRAMENHLDRYRQTRQALKFNMSIHVNFEKVVDPSVTTIPPAVLVTEQFEVYADTDICEILRECT